MPYSLSNFVDAFSYAPMKQKAVISSAIKNDMEIERMALSFKKNNFKCYYKQKSTGRRFISTESSGGYIIEYAYGSNGNYVWNDSWDFSNSDVDDTLSSSTD